VLAEVRGRLPFVPREVKVAGSNVLHAIAQ
jgi:hypothetical protein